MRKVAGGQGYARTALRRPPLSVSVTTMTITALLFASYADALGTDALELELPSGATVRDALAALRARPGAERLAPSPVVAVNLAYARPEHVLRGGDEVAIIPPVAGG